MTRISNGTLVLVFERGWYGLKTTQRRKDYVTVWHYINSYDDRGNT